MVLGSLDQLDLVPGRERHDRLLPGRAATLELAHALPLALVRGRAHGRDLDVEDLLDGLPDLDLVRVDRHLEGDRVELFLPLHALLGHQRLDQHVPGITVHANASWSDNSAAFSNSTRSLRKIW